MINEIEIKGVKYPLRRTCGAMLRFARETGKDISELKGTADVVTFLYFCVKSACNADGVKFDLSLDDFADDISVDRWEAINDENDENAKKKEEVKQ